MNGLLAVMNGDGTARHECKARRSFSQNRRVTGMRISQLQESIKNLMASHGTQKLVS
ncbi:hypothetical protein J6590_075875 [Homalodisca vitripennis]|nr:hypothetical protein J6590_075875 [Homalodisca vitripennis]